MTKRFLAVAVMAALAAGAHADTFILKDGKQVEGTIVHDSGDTYEIETESGPKLHLKKMDVERILPVVKTSSGAPLTGATFTFDKKRKLDTVDLLAAIDTKRDALTGTWKLAGKALTFSDGQHSKLQTTYAVPDEYDLTIELSRKEGADDFYAGLIGGGRQFTFHFDSFKSAWSGPQLIDGKMAGPDSDVGVPGKKVFTNGTPRTAVFMVRKEGLVVRLDGKDFFAWKADWSRVSLHSVFIVPSKTAIFVGAFGSTYSITKMVLTVPKN